MSTGKSSNGAGERRDARAQARAGGSEVVTQTDGGEIDIVLVSHVLVALILSHQFDLRCKGIGGTYTKRRNPLFLCITEFYKATRTTCFQGDLCFQLVVAQLAKKLETIKGQCSDEVDTIPISVPGQLGGPTITGCPFIFGGTQVSVLEFHSDVTVQLNSSTNLEGGILIVPRGTITQPNSLKFSREGRIKVLHQAGLFCISLTNISKKVSIYLIIRSLHASDHRPGNQNRQQCFAHHPLLHYPWWPSP